MGIAFKREAEFLRNQGMSGSQEMTGETVCGFLFRRIFGKCIFRFFKAEVSKDIFGTVAVKALGKQRKKIDPEQEFGDKILQISAFLKNHASKL